MSLIRFHSVALALVLCLASCSPYLSGSEWPDSYVSRFGASGLRLDREAKDVPFDAETLAEHFRLTVFKREHEWLWATWEGAPEREDEYLLRRWDEDLNIRVVSSGPNYQANLQRIRKMATLLSEVTGRKIRVQAHGRGPRYMCCF